MNVRWPIVSIAIVSTLLAQESSVFQDEVSKGTAAYKSAHYRDAVTHFQRAVDLDPANGKAHLYLATAYYIQWVPGADAAENQKNYDLAAKEFAAVLENDPKDETALAMMASMTYNLAGAAAPENKIAALDQSAGWNRRRIAVNPNVAEPYYYLGVIAWAKSYRPIQHARGALHMAASDPGPITDSTVRATLRTQLEATIQEGLADLQKCLEIDPQNDDAMTYLNLLLRKQADLEDSAQASQVDVAKADEWADQALETKKRKAEQAAPDQVAIFKVAAEEAGKDVIRKVAPVYPLAAKTSGVQGSVAFTIVIDAQGGVESAQLVSGHPLLVDAARQAVLQWKYRPMLQNGKLVRRLTEVVINFRLAR